MSASLLSHSQIQRLPMSALAKCTHRELTISDGREAAVYGKIKPIYIARLVGSKKQRRCRNLLRTAHLSTRNHGLEHLPRCLVEALGSAVSTCPGLSTFTRIFLSFSSLSHVRAKERSAALLAAYTPKPGKPFTEATDPVMMIDPPSFISGNAF